MAKLKYCPNCQAVWGFEEVESQQCDACGWPDPDLVSDFNDDESFDIDDDEDDDDDRWNPNDSRNL